jgi:Tol biopolymer transport system component
MRKPLVWIACVFAVLVAPAAARASFAGTNGRIAFTTLSDLELSHVFTVSPDGSGLSELTGYALEDSQPAFSPDGASIAFTSTRDGNAEIYVMAADGSGVTRLTDDPVGDFDPAFSADGSRIAFSSDRDGNWEIYRAGSDGTDPVRLTNDPERDGDPSFSPDGARIAFTHGVPFRASHVYVMSAEGSSPVLLTSSPTSADHDPSFSPDGAEIAFGGDFSCPPGMACAAAIGGGVYTVAGDGSGPRTLVTWGPFADPDWGVLTPVRPAPAPTPTVESPITIAG